MSNSSLRNLLGRGRPVWIMGAHDVLSARIVAKAGFDAIGLQSLQMSFVNGVPDIGVIGPEELVRVCRRIRHAVDLPIVVDFEQGFGEPYVSVYWMKELQAAGASAIHIDDYGLPYKCPFIPPHVMGLEDMELTAAKIRALVGEKHDPDFMVIGRPGTFVAAVYDSEEERRADWLRRARSYLTAGADALFPICWTVDQARWFRSQVPGPLIAIRTLGTKINVDRVQYSDAIMNLSVQEIYDLGYEMYIEPTTMIGVAANAMWNAAQHAHKSGSSLALTEQHGNLYDLLERWMDVKTVREYRTKYVDQNPRD
jgi:2-methylisocitrate lyase-like PEP mutase family enzyme